MNTPLEIAKKANKASRQLALATTSQKNQTLNTIAQKIIEQQNEILSANAEDVSDAEKNGLAPAMVDRLMLNPARLQGMANDIKQLIKLPDPVGEQFDTRDIDESELHIFKQRVPLGVLAVIYEARPNVTLDSAGLAIKSGNAVILRGGKETIRSNRVLAEIIRHAMQSCGLDADGLQFIDNPDRKLLLELLKLHEWIDMVIPRGGNALQNFCREKSTIPVITGGIGICHLFVDESAYVDYSIDVVRNAKIQRPTVCNALDTVLVHKKIADKFIPEMYEVLARDGVTFRADAAACEVFLKAFDGVPAEVLPAGDQDFDTEWLSMVLGIRIVENLDEAVNHIAQHSTHHSDGILTDEPKNAERFIREVDSAAVYVNASTRFTDGSQFGLGAEVAISTQRLHARGPMGLRELTTYKWVVKGEYSVRK